MRSTPFLLVRGPDACARIAVVELRRRAGLDAQLLEQIANGGHVVQLDRRRRDAFASSRWRPAGICPRERRPWRDDLVDAIEESGVELDLDGAQLALELLQGARADDRSGDGGMLEHERERKVDQGDAGALGELGEGLGGI